MEDCGDKSRPKITAANPLCILHRNDDNDEDVEDDVEELDCDDSSLADAAPPYVLVESRCNNRDVPPPNFIGPMVTILL